MSDPVLELEDVVKEYGDPGGVRTRVLHGVSLRVRRAEFGALVGPSGSGKSTLLNLLGLLDRPSAGVLRVQGKDTRELGDREITRLRGATLGFVFQFHHLLPALSAEENVLLPLAIREGRTTTPMRGEARRLLDAVGLGARASARPRDLSGGQQQRVAIARALVQRPALVLADEPTGSLDTAAANEVFALFQRMHEQEGCAFLIVTHDRALAARCDRVVTLVDGCIESDVSK